MSICKNGTLTCKRGWWHFVSRDPAGKLKWQALKTQDKAEAKKRAARLTGSALMADDRAAWLRSLVDTGRWAQTELDALEGRATAAGVGWDDLMASWQAAVPSLTRHAATLEVYELYLDALSRWATAAGIATPASLKAEQAAAFLARDGAKSSSMRGTSVLRRVWRDLRLGADVWPAGGPGAQKTRYRRLSVGEVRAVIAVLRAGKTKDRKGGKWTKGARKALPDVADLVALGYHTGLRRGDCAGLRVGNIDEGGEFLRVMPAKTAERKGAVLLIPLQEETRQLVARLAAAAGSDPDALLFPLLADGWISKRIGLAFTRAGVLDNSHGRASFHSLRATFISMMDEAGVPPHITDSITGHAKAGMHGRYTQPGRDALAEAVRRAITPLGIEL